MTITSDCLILRSPMSNVLLEMALKYAAMGLSVIPVVPGDKKPLIKWEAFQERRATKLEITSWWSSNKNANIGIVTGPISGLAVVDIDTEEGKEAILEYIPDSLVVPTTKTPNGGNHLYFSYPDNFDIGNNARLIPGCDFRGKGGFVVAPPSANGNGNCYEWLIDFDRSALLPLPAAYINKISTNNKGCSNFVVNDTTKDYIGYKILQEGSRDNDLFHAAHCLLKGGCQKSTVKQILNILAKNCNPPFPETEIPVKIKSAMARLEKRDGSLADEVKDFCLLQEGYFFTTDILQTLQITTREEKKNLTVILVRLKDQGIIESYGEKRGCYRRVQSDCQDIDLWSPTAKPLNIKYPLGIHELVVTHPKNIIIIAGEPNAGKSAWLLNFAQKNSGCGQEVIYFSSEMGAIELQARLKKFNIPMDEWRKIQWKERASDFASVIRPNAINIIDFLEVHDEFYKIGLLIKKIFDKLENGIAVIALQKNKGRDEGLGGMRSLEKARLYMAMEPGKLKIVKAKNWRNDEINPNGLERTYKLIAGCNFRPDGEWKEAGVIPGGVQTRARGYR